MIVVTGAAGFIGSNLVAKLEENGLGPLVVCDTLGSDERWQNLKRRAIVDLISPEDLKPFLERHGHDVQMIYHLGANSSTTETNADLMMSMNFKFSMMLLEMCRQQDIRLVYASSAATYGDGSVGFDDASPLANLVPLNVYGWSKHLFDRCVEAAGSRVPPQCTGLKFFNVYGPNEYHKGDMQSVVSKTFRQISQGEPARLFKSHREGFEDGGQLRDFIWVGDCVDTMIWLYHHPQVSGLFNLGTGKARSFYDLAVAVFKALGKDPVIEFVDMPLSLQPKYQYFTEAVMTRLRGTGYDAPFTSLEEGVRQYVQQYLVKADPYR